jgi:hypothetical protein
VLEQQYYANEKLRELESGRILCAQPEAPLHGKPALAPLARPVGRALHRLGHRLESWATTAADVEGSELGLRGKTG